MTWVSTVQGGGLSFSFLGAQDIQEAVGLSSAGLRIRLSSTACRFLVDRTTIDLQIGTCCPRPARFSTRQPKPDSLLVGEVRDLESHLLSCDITPIDVRSAPGGAWPLTLAHVMEVEGYEYVATLSKKNHCPSSAVTTMRAARHPNNSRLMVSHRG